MNLAAVVLAAGAGTRFGGDKLSARFHGEPLIVHTIRSALAAPVGRVVVVCPPELDIGSWPAVETVRIVSNALSTSLKAGIAVVPDVDGAFIFLGDMPLIPNDIARQLAESLGTSFAAIPCYRGKPGHPVLLSARAFPEIAHLQGDQGAGRLLKARTDIAFVESENEAVVHDIDTIEDIARLERLKTR